MKAAGALFFIAGTILILGILLSEILYPNYNVSKNMISDLGVNSASSTIFALTLVVSGILVVLGSYLLYKASSKKLLSIVIILTGIGTIGVGLFPEFRLHLHLTFAFLAFGMAGVSAILSSQITKPPFSVLSVILGLITLVFMALGLFFPEITVPILGRGGNERFVFYPSVIWLLGFGGYLMGNSKSVRY